MTAEKPYEVTRQDTVEIDTPITDLHFSQDGNWVFATTQSTESNLNIFSSSDPTTPLSLTLPFLPAQLQIRANDQLNETFFEVWLISQGGDRIGMAVFDPATQNIAFLGSAEAPSWVQSLFVPRQNTQGDSTEIANCCYGLSDELKKDDWITTADASGNLLYWHWQLSGDDFSSLRFDLKRLNSTSDSSDAIISCVDTEDESKNSCGDLTWTSLNDSVALWDEWIFDQDVEATWEGAPNGFNLRPVIFDSTENKFRPAQGTFPVIDGLQAGDEIRIANNSSSDDCVGSNTYTLDNVLPEELTVTDLENNAGDCLSQNELTLSIYPVNAFNLHDQRHGDLGIIRANNEQQFVVLMGHWEARFTLEDLEQWTRGDTAKISITDGLVPVGLELSQNFSYQSGGFGTYGNYAAAITGGEVQMTDSEDNMTMVRRIYLITETGSLFEMAEGETDLANVISYK